jgi:hypothetical protein
MQTTKNIRFHKTLGAQINLFSEFSLKFEMYFLRRELGAELISRLALTLTYHLKLIKRCFLAIEIYSTKK